MGASKGYFYFAICMAIGATLLATGSAEFWHILSVALRRGRLLGSLVPLLIHGTQAILGLALLLRRARGIVAAFCLVTALSGLSPPDLDLIGELRGEPYLAEFPYTLFFLAAFVVLLLPSPRVPVLRIPAEPTGRHWRRWLLASLQGEGVRPVRDRFSQAFALAAMPYIGAVVLVVVTLPLRFSDLPLPIVVLGIVVAVFALTGAWIGMRKVAAKVGGSSYQRALGRAAQIHIQARSAEQELQRPGARRPILYLRSFAIDNQPEHEQRVVSVLRKIAPVIAIGRPGEEFPPLGAARFYVDDAHWRAKVADITKVAQLVVWVTGTTEGLAWELNHIRQALAPERLVLWAHPHLLGLTGQAAEAEWTRFRELFGNILPAPLPGELGETRFLYFTENWGATMSVSAKGLGADQAAILRVLENKKMAGPIHRRARIKKIYEYGIISFATLLFGGMLLATILDR